MQRISTEGEKEVMSAQADVAERHFRDWPAGGREGAEKEEGGV